MYTVKFYYKGDNCTTYVTKSSNRNYLVKALNSKDHEVIDFPENYDKWVIEEEGSVNKKEIKVLDHGSVKLLNIAGPVRRPLGEFDGSDRDPAITARISFDNMDEERLEEQDHKLLKYLMNNHHWTPVEMVEVWLEMRLPIFVARQFVRHRTACLNEVSARYTALPAKWYIPEKETVGVKSKSNKQGRDLAPWESLKAVDQHTVTHFINELNEHNKTGHTLYQKHLAQGIAPELARPFLQVNHYTHWVWKQDLRNMLGFLRLRLDGHAQYEARQYAQAIYDLLYQYLPVTLGWLEQQEPPAPEQTKGLWNYVKRVFKEGVA